VSCIAGSQAESHDGPSQPGQPPDSRRIIAESFHFSRRHNSRQVIIELAAVMIEGWPLASYASQLPDTIEIAEDSQMPLPLRRLVFSWPY